MTTAVLWGTTGAAAALMPDQSPLAIGAASVGIGGLVLGLISLKAIRDAFGLPGVSRLILLGAVGLSIYQPLFYVSVSLAGVALGTIVSLGSGPLFAGVLEWIVDRKRLTNLWMCSMAIMLTGVGVLLAARGSAEHDSTATIEGLMLGVAAGLGSGATYAFYAFATGRLGQPHPSREGLRHRTVVAAIQGTASLPMLALFALTSQESTFSISVWPLLVYIALIPTALGHTLLAFGLGRMKASTVTLYTVLEAVVATILGITFFDETFLPFGFVGFIMVLASLALLNAPLPAPAAVGRPLEVRVDKSRAH